MDDRFNLQSVCFTKSLLLDRIADNTIRFLLDLNSAMKAQRRKILLLIDNAPSHIFEEDKLTNVKVAFLPPNMTSHIQPMDAGII